MLLTLTTTHRPATDLGYLLHKHPAKAQTFRLSFGQAQVFYPEAGPDRCTAALVLDVDPVERVRDRQGSAGANRALEQYVNDRPYVASSLLSVAIGEVYGSALHGRCATRPDLVDAPLPLIATLSVLPCRGGESLLRRLFEPLGYVVEPERLPLDEQFPEWGDSAYYRVRLSATVRLRELLTHLYVLIPVLDNDKHYWVGDAEVDKLLRHGSHWLSIHPERELIARRYLKHQKSLARQALERLLEADSDRAMFTETATMATAERETTLEAPLGLNQIRLATVARVLREHGARCVADLGCGEGQLLAVLLQHQEFERLVGVDVSLRALERAAERLNLERLPERQRARLELLHGSLSYRDERFHSCDAAAVIEVIEHLDLARLAAFEWVLFECFHPALIVLTTPNADDNARWPHLPAGQFRHPDHRFEWTRAEFSAWARRIAARFGYAVAFQPVGEPDPDWGPPTQMAIFTRSPDLATRSEPNAQPA
ncbi:MAG: 3' terminal RNA ribose 2'-O-methyltransferase Hen1 [Candidatus Contendobacter sp.]|nr:3' terminal RNA ribose 2'-O-methyltransferase Hen1 [Candidatus Contendobacter sp.]